MEAAEAAIGALDELLTRRHVGPDQSVQNLLNWRMTEHLKRLRGAEAVRAWRLYPDLLGERTPVLDRVERSAGEYVTVLAPRLASGRQGVTRGLTTLVLMLTWPRDHIVVRAALFHDLGKRLLGHPLLTTGPLTGADCAACLELAGQVRDVLADWGWQPQDMIDVQSFLWVAAQSRYGDEQPARTAAASPMEGLAFTDALDEDAFVEAFRQAFPDQYTGSPGKVAAGTRKARELWLLRDIQPGDIVLATRGVSELLALDPAEKRRWMNSTIVPVERALYAGILAGRTAEKTEPSGEAYVEPPFPAIVTTILKSGLRLSERMIRRYHAAVKARGFVILAGVSGTGKTWLAEAYAYAVGARSSCSVWRAGRAASVPGRRAGPAGTGS